MRSGKGRILSSKRVDVKEGSGSERLKGERKKNEQGEGKQECAGCHCEGDLCTLLVLFDTFCNMHKRLFFRYKRTAPTWIGPERHVKKHSKDYQQSMTILTLQHVCSRDKYVTNPQRKPQKHPLCGKVQNNRTSVV